jgi:SAM-dependent methyltransferase
MGHGHGEAPGAPKKDERVFRYFARERELLRSLGPGGLILDLGCAGGAHMERLSAGGRVVGVDASIERLGTARRIAPVAAAVGERLPFADGSFDFVYVSHVLHHARDHRAALAEIHRVLKPQGLLFLIETVDDNPAMRFARAIRPRWESDRVFSRFRFEGLTRDVRRAGFTVAETQQFNVLWWAWAYAQRSFTPLARLAEAATRLELALDRRLSRFGAWGFLLARKA